MDSNLTLFVGVVLICVIAAFIGFAVRFLSKGTPKYDERQARARGNAYKAAFWTGVSFTLLNGIFDSMNDKPWGDPITEAFICVCISVMVFAVVCIFTDAYFALNENRRKCIITFGVIALVNAAIVTINISAGFPFAENGVLGFRSLNIVVLVMFVVLFIALLIKAALDARSDRE